PPEKLPLGSGKSLTPDEQALLASEKGRVLSPDGKWAASQSWHGTGAKVWDAQTGKLLRELTTDDTGVLFSPDGKWLMTGSQKEYVFWQVGSWKACRRISRARGYVAGIIAFSPDAKLLAI